MKLKVQLLKDAPLKRLLKSGRAAVSWIRDSDDVLDSFIDTVWQGMADEPPAGILLKLFCLFRLSLLS